MTEAEWFDASDPYPRQLLIIQQHAPVRKLRLIAAVLARHQHQRLTDEDAKLCDDLIELCADYPEHQAQWQEALHQRPGNWRFTQIVWGTELHVVVKALRKLVAFNQYDPVEYPLRVMLEVVGNPFRASRFDPSWRSPDVLLLARRAYSTHDFSALPILADALQDAGCNSDELLSHLRDPEATHVRGCWALDLVLGKS